MAVSAASPRTWATPTSPIPGLSPAQALDVAAHFCERHAFSNLPEPKDSQTYSVSWALPHIITSSRGLAPLGDMRRGLWGRVLQLADDLTQIAMRDTCNEFKDIYELFQYYRLNLCRIVLDGRDAHKIYVLDYVAAQRPKPMFAGQGTAASPGTRKVKKQPYAKRLRAARERLVAYPVLREIPRRGLLRKKVVASGNVFFQLYALESFRRPRTISVLDWQGFDDPGSRRNGIVTPFRHTLVETEPVQDALLCGRSGLENNCGVARLERWTSARNLADPGVQELSKLRTEWLLNHRRTVGVYEASKSAYHVAHAEWKENRRWQHVQSGPKPDAPEGPLLDGQAHATWSSAAIEQDGLDDTFTLEAVAAIVSGRFKSAATSTSSKPHWADSFATVSTAWTTSPNEPLLIMLTPHIHGWMPMNATFPLIEDAAANLLKDPTWVIARERDAEEQKAHAAAQLKIATAEMVAALGPDVKVEVLSDGRSLFTYARRDSSDEEEESSLARIISIICGPSLGGEDGQGESHFEEIV